jgi:hypothetical protein
VHFLAAAPKIARNEMIASILTREVDLNDDEASKIPATAAPAADEIRPTEKGKTVSFAA